ncbi:uncharacterized protein KD926_008804 [Aspergillus affinis]|uniref:uncharacterized protein n=1 Tax=Aspergillus affinis TaxID=1070780 RepID=UPI0022FE70F7|nr:uncharacterized protein KD926_008804 [Aspergillus affinis]KAI9045377.1 hypothetical protein KD926_008804 [Aspergillus affinis]
MPMPVPIHLASSTQQNLQPHLLSNMGHETITAMTPDDQAREQELNISLFESLTCQSCAMKIPRTTYHRHLESQIYVATRDPPFRLSRAELNGLRAFGLSPSNTTPPGAEDTHEIDTENQISPHTLAPEDICDDDDDDDDTTPIAPHATPSPRRRPGYRALMTAAQRAAYEDQVKRYVDELPGRDVAMARYHVDYHVHLHWLSRRGALTLCRDVKEMHELRKWRWKMAQMDVQAASSQGEEGSACSGDDGDEDGGDRKRKRNGVTVRRWGWPGDSNLFMMYQTALWRQKWWVRQKHLDEVRVKWAAIMAERHRQRKCVKVKLFWGNGYKNLLREIELEEPWLGEHIVR